jgi:hypothetical protein
LKLVEQDNNRERNAQHEAGYKKGHQPDNKEGQLSYNNHTVNDFLEKMALFVQ